MVETKRLKDRGSVVGAAAAVLLGSLLSACLGSNICGSEMVERGGYCVVPPDSDSVVDSETVASDAGSGIVDGGDTESTGDSETQGQELPSGMGDDCTAHSDCTLDADYCLQPNYPDLNGYCTLQGCDTAMNDCPDGYECIDLASYFPGLPTVCAASEAAAKLAARRGEK